MMHLKKYLSLVVLLIIVLLLGSCKAVDNHHSHSGSQWVIDIDSTCELDGKMSKYCDSCGELISSKVIPASGHTETHWVVIKEATEIEKGLMQLVCKECDTYILEEEIPTIGHVCVFDDWSIVKEPTCQFLGRKEHKCISCGIKQSEPLPKLDHEINDWVVTNEAKYCSDVGVKNLYCRNCNAIIETISFSGTEHKSTKKVVVTEATCFSQGEIREECLNCKSIINVITQPILEHDYNDWNQIKAPSCTVTGEMVRICSKCKNKESKYIDLLPHTEGEWKVELEPSCIGSGLRVKKCLVCNYIIDSESIQNLGHLDATWEDHSVNSCISKEYWLVCKRDNCDGSIPLEIMTEDGEGHAFDNWEIGSSGWCDVYGYLINGKCTKCGYITNEKKRTPPLGHNYEWTIIEESTCTEMGKKLGKCLRCGISKYENIDAEGHSFVGYKCTKCSDYVDYVYGNQFLDSIEGVNITYTGTSYFRSLATGYFYLCLRVENTNNTEVLVQIRKELLNGYNANYSGAFSVHIPAGQVVDTYITINTISLKTLNQNNFDSYKCNFYVAKDMVNINNGITSSNECWFYPYK